MNWTASVPARLSNTARVDASCTSPPVFHRNSRKAQVRASNCAPENAKPRKPRTRSRFWRNWEWETSSSHVAGGAMPWRSSRSARQTITPGLIQWGSAQVLPSSVHCSSATGRYLARHSSVRNSSRGQIRSRSINSPRR